MLWYSLEAPRRGTSNEYPQHMFLWRNKKNIMWTPPLICSYEYVVGTQQKCLAIWDRYPRIIIKYSFLTKIQCTSGYSDIFLISPQKKRYVLGAH